MRLTLHTFLTLDGVMQAPGGPQEDTDDDFVHGGWSFPFADPASGETMVGWFANAEAFLLGRRTYEIFSSYWPKVTDPNDPIAAKLNDRPKYVASTTLRTPTWANTTVLGDDVVAEITELKTRSGGELQVHGSGGLAQTLIDHDLVDEYRLMYLPLHLGTGKKLFRDGTQAATLRLLESTALPSGVVVSIYEPGGPVRYGSFEQPA